MHLSPNRRIALNVFATYARSLFALVCGLFTSRWLLLSLGQEDYGLLGLIGGLMGFISFFNSVLAASVGRFYAFSVGAAKASNSDESIEECRRWFNTALSVHLTLPIVLVLVGYPAGIWAIENWMTIPQDRIVPCVWVFRFTCFSCLVGMMNVPFGAMFTARQEIAELTVYSFVTTIANFILVAYMIAHPGFWLTRYALFACLISVALNGLIAFRAIRAFPECNICFRYMFNRSYLKRILSFAGWQMLGIFCGLMRGQGIALVVNKFFGGGVNAALNIGRTVEGHTTTLAAAMKGAFQPAIVNACGAKDYKSMFALAFRTSKLSVLLTMLFVLPLMLEMKEVVYLWLKYPPRYTIGFCYCMIVYYLVDSITHGHMNAINANGKISRYFIFMSSMAISTVPVAIICCWLGFGPLSVGYTLVFFIMLNSIGRLYFGWKILGLSVRYWFKSILVPVAVVGGVVSAIGCIPLLFLPPSITRVVLTSVCSLSVYVPVTWMFALDAEERLFIKNRFVSRILCRNKENHT